MDPRGWRRARDLQWPSRRLGVETTAVLDAFTSDEVFREVVYAQFAALVADPLGVLSLAQLPALGKLWRLIHRRRLDERRDQLAAVLQQTIPKLQDAESQAIVAAWVAESYNYSDEILVAIDKAPEPVPALTCDEPGETSRAELLEIGRSTAPEVLEKVGQLLSHLQIVTVIPRTAPYLPLSLSDSELFEFLPHVLFPGTRFSRRLAVLLAVLALKTHNVLLSERAARYIAAVRGTWLIRDPIEDNSGSFLEFTLTSPVEVYTPEERAFAERQWRTWALSFAQNRRIGVVVLDTPKLQTLTPCQTLECIRCHQQRSITTMTVDMVCGVCVAPVNLSPLAAEQPGKCHLVSCCSCGGIYEVVNVEKLKCRPKCHYCRQGGTIRKARCIRCGLSFNDPMSKFPSGEFTCLRCVQFEAEALKPTEFTISQLLKDEPFTLCLLGQLGVPAVDYGHSRPRVSNKLFYLPVPVPPSPETIRVRGRVILDPAGVVAKAAELIAEGRRETSVCHLCFREVVAEEIVSACGRPDCPGSACRACLSKWYGAVRPGDVVCLSNMQCPFCRRLPLIKTLNRFNPRCLALAAQADHFDPAFYYAWCSGRCYKVIPAIEKSCAHGTPDFKGKFVCDHCKESKLGQALPAQTRTTPCCQIPCEKAGGCDHMVCRCGAHFCWVCMQVVEAGLIYAHIATHAGVYEAGDDEGEDEL